VAGAVQEVPVGIDIVPKFVSFDLYGTLINYEYDRNVRRILGDRLPAEIADAFEVAGEAIRFDEVMGDWKPYHEIIDRSLRRTMKKFGIEYRDGDGRQAYESITTFGPYPDVPAVLRTLAEEYPLVILSNADDAQIVHNVERLEAPIHAVITAEQARAYKPRLAAFEHMLEKLGAAPDEIVHVSSSPMYDHRPANDAGIVHKVYMDRGWEPDQPWLNYVRITDIAELPAVLGAAQRATAAG
jgi:2-haloacid dehalogenase